MMIEDTTYDLVVVGHGAAGLSAAVAAVEEHADAKVLVLERSSRSERGGNTQWTSAFMRAEAPGAVAQSFVQDFMDFSGGRADEEYASRLAELAPSALTWLQDHGCRFELVPMFFLTLDRPRLGIRGGGASILEVLEGFARENGVEFAYETAAQRLLLDNAGRIVGLTAEVAGHGLVEIAAHNVVLASGGFQGSPELLGRHLGEEYRDMPTVARGGRYNKGEALLMARQIGAQLSGEEAGYHCEPVDPRSKMAEAINMLFPYGVLVNGLGERFVDEGGGSIDEIYESVTRAIADQPAHLAYFIGDESLFEIDGWERAVLTDKPPVRAGSVSALAERLDIEAADLEATVAAYQRACPVGDPGPLQVRVDGAATTGLQPPKSNWARPLDTARLVAWPLTTAVVFTFLGVKVNAEGEVLASDGTSVPGLYAAGECTGAYYGKYPGATSVMRAITFGRLTGAAAVRRIPAAH